MIGMTDRAKYVFGFRNHHLQTQAASTWHRLPACGKTGSKPAPVAEQRKLPGFSAWFALPPDGSRHAAIFVSSHDPKPP